MACHAGSTASCCVEQSRHRQRWRNQKVAVRLQDDAVDRRALQWRSDLLKGFRTSCRLGCVLGRTPQQHGTGCNTWQTCAHWYQDALPQELGEGRWEWWSGPAQSSLNCPC